MKVSELTGAELDYWVAKAESLTLMGSEHASFKQWQSMTRVAPWRYSSRWDHGGLIIEREKIAVIPASAEEGWYGSPWVGKPYYGDSPLVAAMRCYVVSKFGEEVQE